MSRAVQATPRASREVQATPRAPRAAQRTPLETRRERRSASRCPPAPVSLVRLAAGVRRRLRAGRHGGVGARGRGLRDPARPGGRLHATRRAPRAAPTQAACLILLAEPPLGARPFADPLVAGRHDLALVDPDLDADPAEGRLRLREAVVDVGPQRVERHPPLGVRLGARHLAAAEAPPARDLHTLGAGADRRRERPLHRAAEAHAILELLRHGLSHELGVQLRALDLVDVDVDVLLGEGVNLAAQGVHLGARLADDDAGARSVDVDLDPLLVLLDQDVREPGMAELPGDVIADLDVLHQVARELLRPRVPVGLPVVDDSHAEPARMNLLSH